MSRSSPPPTPPLLFLARRGPTLAVPIQALFPNGAPTAANPRAVMGEARQYPGRRIAKRLPATMLAAAGTVVRGHLRSLSRWAHARLQARSAAALEMLDMRLLQEAGLERVDLPTIVPYRHVQLLPTDEQDA